MGVDDREWKSRIKGGGAEQTLRARTSMFVVDLFEKGCPPTQPRQVFQELFCARGLRDAFGAIKAERTVGSVSGSHTSCLSAVGRTRYHEAECASLAIRAPGHLAGALWFSNIQFRGPRKQRFALQLPDVLASGRAEGPQVVNPRMPTRHSRF